MTKLQTFEFEEGSTIMAAWDKLKDYRQKLSTVDQEAGKIYSDAAVTGPLSFPLPRISALPPALPGSGNAVYELVDPNPFEWGPVGKTLNRGLRTRLLER